MTVTLRESDPIIFVPQETALATFINPPHWVEGMNIFTLPSPRGAGSDTFYHIVIDVDGELYATNGTVCNRRTKAAAPPPGSMPLDIVIRALSGAKYLTRTS